MLRSPRPTRFYRSLWIPGSYCLAPGRCLFSQPGGLTAISPELSVATLRDDPNTETDPEGVAENDPLLIRIAITAGKEERINPHPSGLCDPSRVDALIPCFPGVSLTLNPRLIADNPPGC